MSGGIPAGNPGVFLSAVSEGILGEITGKNIAEGFGKIPKAICEEIFGRITGVTGGIPGGTSISSLITAGISGNF